MLASQEHLSTCDQCLGESGCDSHMSSQKQLETSEIDVPVQPSRAVSIKSPVRFDSRFIEHSAVRLA